MQISANKGQKARPSIIRGLVDSLKATSDVTRLRILGLLREAGALCVCELAASLSLPHYSISRQLNILKRAALLESRREGTYVFYSITKSPAARLIEPVLRHLGAANGNDAVVAGDRSRLKTILRLRNSQNRLTAYCEAVEPVMEREQTGS